MSRGSKKKEKTFDLNATGRPPRALKESQLKAHFSSLKENTAWKDTLLICSQLGEKAYGTSWIANYFLGALEATLQYQALLRESEKFLNSHPRNPTLLSWNAHALRLNGRVDESVDLLRRAIKLAKPNAGLFNSLGSALKETGQFEEASSWFDRAIAIKPTLAKAHWNRSDLTKDHQRAADSINKILESETDNSDQNLFHFSLYRHYEALGEYDKAFQHLKIGNALKRSKIDYQSTEAGQLTERILSFFGSDISSSQVGEPIDKQPIFIFGLPRSGTTLVEQILASHPNVYGGNELTFLNDASTRVQTRLRTQGQFPDWLSELSATGWEDIGRQYLNLTDSLDFSEPRITDKSLMNFRAAGLIAKALPSAKMVHVVRNPMDVAFGCYRQVFGSGHLFSYDFEEIAGMLVDHQKLLTHWQQHLAKEQYYVLNYELLVETPESEISKLLEFCNLSNDPNCYTPEKTDRTVRTLSSTQVRQPINRSGLDSWKRYESQLEPLREALARRSLI